jgi:hypothetical protein
MSFEEALAFLNVTEDTQSDSIEAAAVAMVSIPLYFAFKLHHRSILSWVICS